MDDSSTIKYRHFFQHLVEAVPWPLLVIDTDLSICHCNGRVQSLFGLVASPVEQPLNQVLDDVAILQWVQASILTGSPQVNEFERAASGGAWKVSVTPVEHRKLPHSKRKKRSGGLSKLPYRYFSVVIEDLSELRRLERV